MNYSYKPKNGFKRGDPPRTDWKCVCGYTNSGRVRHVKMKREVCQQCGLFREDSEDA